MLSLLNRTGRSTVTKRRFTSKQIPICISDRGTPGGARDTIALEKQEEEEEKVEEKMGLEEEEEVNKKLEHVEVWDIESLGLDPFVRDPFKQAGELIKWV